MSKQISRRELLATGAAVGSTFVLPTISRGAAPASGGVSFIVLGDLHYDRPEHHDMAYLADGHHGDINQIKSYCKTTSEFTPGLFDELAQTVRDAKSKPSFVIQVGDLVEGLCGKPELATMQCKDALAAIAAAKIGVPFITIKGNHDVTGPGAVEAFNAQVLPFVAEQSRTDIRGANYTLELNGHWFVFFDAYDRSSLEWLEKTTARQPDRPMFFVVHPPVVPYNARATWHIFAKPEQADPRKRLLDILGRHRAVALTGHLHKYAALGRRTEHGVFTQLAVCSVLRNAAEKPRDIATGLNEYNGDLVRFEPGHSPETVDQRRAILNEEKAAITSFDFADLPGYAIIHVDGDGRTTADIYAGLGRTLWKTVDLTAPAV